MGNAWSAFFRAWVVVFLLAFAVLVSGKGLEQYTAHGGPIKGLTLSPDGRWLVSTSFDYSAVIWSADTLQEQHRLIGHEAAVNTAAFSPDGRFLVTAGDDNTLRVWRMDALLHGTADAKPKVLTGHTAKIVHVAFSTDGKTLASSSWDHSIGLWSVPDFAHRAFLRVHEAPVNAAAFSRDGTQLYSAGGDGHIRLWDVAKAQYLRSILNSGWGINALVIDETSDLMAYGTTSGQLRTRPLHGNGEPVDLLLEGPPVLTLTFDPASHRLACGNAKGRLLIVHTGTGTVEHDFRAVNGPVWTAQLMPRGEAIVLAGLDDFITRLPLTESTDGLGVTERERRFHPTSPLGNGERQYARKCSICHSLEPDDRRRAGPSLLGVFGRKAGALSGYPYSPALAEAGIVWSEETIDALFKEGPEIVTPGSKMPLQRIRNHKDRRDLIEYLKTNTRLEQ